MDGRAWFYAFLWYLVVQALSRLLTPAGLNVNLAHRIQEGWEQTFSSYWKFWCVLSVLTGILLWIFGYLLQQLWPISRESPAAAPST
jgi:type II secretory pathway component PulL